MAQKLTANKSLRLLALHGHRQSGEIFAKKTGALKKILTSLGVSFIHYPTAPHKLKELNEDGEEVYSWFQWEPEEKWSEPDRYVGVEETLAFIKQQFIEYGPFDGVLGFSQGGVLLSVLAGMRVQKEESTAYNPKSQNPIAFDFAIFAATFAPLVSEYFYYTMRSSTCAPLATLHIYGTGDPLVSHTMSRKLASEFEAQAASFNANGNQNLENNEPSQDPSHSSPSSLSIPSSNQKRSYKTSVMHLEHPGGHFIVTNAASKPTYKLFFEQFAKDFPKLS